MLLSVVLLVVGLAVLIGGADLLVRGVSALATAAGVPALVVGMTVVSFGTSTPEVVINTLAAWQSNSGLAFGNIVGACTVNIGVVLGVSAIVRPISVQRSITTREIPMMLLAVAAALVLASDAILDGAAPLISRADGLILLLLFCVFLYYTVQEVLRRRSDPYVRAAVEAVTEEEKRPPRRPWVRNAAFTLVGLAAVATGGRLTVTYAVTLAEAFGVPPVLIGLTLVSIGTTLPELTTSIIASWRGQSDLALGNVIGSNLFNILFIGGLSATLGTLRVPDGGQLDLLLLLALAVALLPLSLTAQRHITRTEGSLLLLGYLGYTIWRVITTAAGAP